MTNKIYKATTAKKSRLFFPVSLVKKAILLLVFIAGTCGYMQAQITVNPGAVPYTTLGAAFTAINAGTHTGALTIDVNGTSTEPAMAVLNSSGTGLANYTSLLIRPVSATATITGSLSNAVIKLLGADNVTIDGVNGGNQLTIRNTFSSTGPAIIWLGSASAADGCTNNIIRNCIITGNSSTTTFIGVVISSGITIGGLAEALNSNNAIQGNTVSASSYGIALVGGGGVVGNDLANIISGNTIGSTIPASKMSIRSIFIAQQQNVSVTQNIIFGNSSATTTPANTGIFVGGGISGGSIDKNVISDIKKASIWGCSGIQLNSSTASSNLTVSNNMIYDIAAGGFNGTDLDDNGYGIAVASGGGYNIWYNSVNLNTNQPTSVGTTAAMWIGTTVTTGGAINLRNNVFSNTQTNSTRYSIFCGPASSVFSAIDYNDYYSTGDVGFIGTAQPTLAAWQAATIGVGGDVNSVAVNPSFFTPTNLHLFFNSPLNGLATPIGAINRDIDGDVRNATTPDIGADEFTPSTCSANTGGTATATNLSICATGSTTLSSAGYAFGTGISYQWEYFSGTWLPLAGQTNPFSAVVTGVSATTQYRLAVTCSNCCGGAPGFSNTVIITVNNPTVSGTTPGTRCGIGTVSLAATAAGTLNWYAASTGGASLFTGSPFTTPSITTSTNFYVSSSISGSAATGGKPTTTGVDGGFAGPDAGLVFDALTPFRLVSVRMYPQGTSSVNIQALTSAGALIPGCFTTANFTGPVAGGVVVTLPASFVIPPGTNHRLVVTSNSANIQMWRDFSGISFPYAVGSAANITTGWLGGNFNTYYFFYDWQIIEICEGLRTAVLATVTPPPAFASVLPNAGPGRTICAGNSVTLNAIGGGYSSYVWNPGTLPNPTVVTPTATTTYTITATTASCRRDSAILITVNPAPTPITVTPASATVCNGTIIPITASGGQLIGQTIFNEPFEGSPLAQFTLTGTGVTAAANTTYYQQGVQSVLLTHGNSIDGQLAMTTGVNLSTYLNPRLTFHQICGLEDGFDYGYIQYSTDGGTVWTSFPTTSYIGTGGLMNGVVSFDAASYPDWLAQMDNGVSPGTGPATSLWKLETINLATWASATNFKVRFRLTSDGSLLYFGWLIDNVNINGDGQAPIIWTPCPGSELFSNPAATIPYVCGTPALTVYSQPTVSHTYTATASGGVGCNQTANSVITVTGATPPSVSIAAAGGTTICQGGCVTFTATLVNGGGNPGFKWFVNGVQVNGPVNPGFNSNPGQNPYTICNLANGDVVTCQILSNAGGCATPNPSPVSAGLTMTVNPKPIVSIDGALTRCFPSTLTVTTTGIITGYEWFQGAVPVGVLSTYNATVPGAYTCIVTSDQGCKDTSTVVLAEQTYTITSSAGPNGTITPLGVITVNCGANQTFTITPNGGGYTVCDVLVDGISQGIIGTYTFTNVTANHTISVTFCLTGCPNPPTASAGPNDSFCANATYTLAGSVGGSATSGTWSGGGGTFNPNNTTLNAIYTPSIGEIGAGTVTLTLTSNNPLGGLCIVSTSTVTLTINPVPVVTINGLLGVCSGPATTTTLTASATILAGTITGYQWYNSVPLLIGSAASQLISVIGNYSVTTNASNGCSTITPLSIIAFTNPSVPTITGSNSICAGTSSTLIANVAAPGNSGATIPASGYQWYNPASIAGATAVSYAAAAPATYTVTATNSNGCLSAASVGFAVAYDVSPLSGAYTIGVGAASCTNYTSFATAIADLNLRSVAGNVRFDIPAGYTETVPSLGLKLGANTGPNLNDDVFTNGWSITFRKSGAGANPILNAYSGGVATPTSAIPDGIWSFRGIDNVVIDAIDLVDGNTTNNATMEYGFGFFKLTATDGAQNNTVQNCTITLRRINDAAGGTILPSGSIGIVVINSLATAANTALTPTLASGTNSNNKFYTNTIQNCHTGIGFVGFAATSPFTLGDTGNDIGGITNLTGNNIINFGGAVASTTASIGITANQQWGMNISNNVINNNNGAGVNHVSILRGIVGVLATSASITINSNTITLISGATGQLCAAIENGIGATPASNTVTISNNIITGSYPTATTGGLTGISNTANPASVVMSGNSFQSFTLPGTGAFIGISNGGAATTVTMNNNILQNGTITSTGAFTGISNLIAGATNLTLSGNTVSGITKGIGSVATTINWMQTSASTNATVNDNIITNNVVTAGAANTTVNCILGNIASYQLDNNFISNNSITGVSSAFTAVMNGYNNISTATQSIVTNNTIRKLFVTGTSTGLVTMHGLFCTAAAAAVSQTINNNTISNLYCSFAMPSTIYGIRVSNAVTVNIFKNKVDSLFPGAGATSLAAGIRVQNANTANIHNNFINLDLTQATLPAANAVLTGSDNLKGMDLTDATVGHVINAYYNTIRLAGSGSGATFGSSSISVFSPNPTVDLRNNILVNLTTPGGTSPGFAVAYRRPVGLANYATTSNNNLFYAGVPSASRLLYFDISTAYQTLAAYQAGAGMSPRETNSVSTLPNFVSVTNLHLVPGTNCSTDGGAQVIATYTADYDTDTRDATTPDIGADEFIGTGGGPGVWKGVTTDWNDVQNWCDAVPNTATNVTIPTGLTFYPIITAATPVAKNVSIASGGSITITGVGKLAIHGTITNAGTFTVVDGTIELAGTTAQTIPAGVFQNNDLKNLVINNGAGVTLGGVLNLYGKLSFTGSNRAFGTAGFLTLRSTATGTASVGDITNNGVNTGNTITGDVTVERFTTARRAWRLLSVPTQNNLQTIHEAWQENQAANAPTPAGYGIHITKDSANWNTYGFDIQTLPGPSMKVYQPATNNWKGITSTINVPGVSDGRFVTGRGYMVLVRGDRTVNTFPSAATTSVLRDKGALVTGTFAAAAIGAGQFAVIGNPYASAVDFTKLTRGNLNNAYYLWDPQMGSLGAYVTFTGPLYVPAGSISYTTNNFIESGQAFFVQSSGLAGSLSFLENSKVDGSNLVSRPISTGKQLRTKLYVTTGGSPHLYDAVINEFDNSYANTVDEMDATKLLNFGENLGIKVADKILSVERRAELSVTDTIFYNLGNSRVQNYQLEFIAENIDQPGLSGFLEDNYLHTSTVVSMTGTTKVDFSVINEAGSYASDRFRLVFKQVGGPVPVTFTSVRAHKQDRNIVVDWKVEHEQNIHHYNVERSGEGRNFTKVGEQAARGTGAGEIQYSWLDTNPYGGDNFYRIISVGMDSEKKQSQVVKVNMEKLASAITVFPNPVREDGIVYVSLENKAAGSYQVMIVNAAGQVVLKQSLNHGGGSSVYSITPGRTMAHGNYLLNVVGDDHVNLTFKVVY